MKTDYVKLKRHFDKLLFGGYPYNTGLEPIRDTYKYAFNNEINLYDAYESKMNIMGNPITSLISLVGPDDDEIPLQRGIMVVGNSLACVSVFADGILKGSIEKCYIDEVFKSMSNVVASDQLYRPDILAIQNPYMTFIKTIPLYMTYHHINECAPSICDDSIFINIIKKYYCADDDTEKLYDSLTSTKFSEDIDEIISTITCKGTICPLG